MLTRRLQKFQNSYFVNIPAQLARILEWKKGDLLKVEIIDGKSVLIKKILPREVLTGEVPIKVNEQNLKSEDVGQMGD